MPPSYIVFYGLQGSGKSTFVNALLGKELMPADGLRPTTWPCRIRHTPNGAAPKLELNSVDPFQKIIFKLQTQKYKFSTLIHNSNDSHYDPYHANYREPADATRADPPILDEKTYRAWNNLVVKPESNLRRFEETNFRLSNTSVGESAIRDLLEQLHDIIRLCEIFDVDIPTKVRKSYKQWPLISLKIEAFRDINKQFEIVDLPGTPPDSLGNNEWVEVIAKHTLAIVPVISFRSQDSWGPLIPCFEKRPPPSLVVCTHYNPLTNTEDEVKQHCSRIKREFRIRDPSSIIQYSDACLALGLQMIKGKNSDSRSELENAAPVRYCIEVIAGTAGRDEFWNNLVENETRLKEQLGPVQGVFSSTLTPQPPLLQFYMWLSKLFNH